MAVDFRELCKLQMAEIDRQRAVLGQLRAENQRLVDWIMGEGPDALTTLQKIYSDPKTPLPHQISASKAAIDHERAKPVRTVVNNVVTLFDQLERPRLAALEAREAARKTIEHAPATGTVLGEGQGHHGAWQDADKGDPAA
jgi:hypothetical protein